MRLLWCIFLFLLLIHSLHASAALEPQVGQRFIDFQTSTSSSQAQNEFLLGVGWVHSFGYSQAQERFRRALSHDKSFCMAYWGLALANAQPVWSTGNLTAAQGALQDLHAYCDFAAISNRERSYISAVESYFTVMSTEPHIVPFNSSTYISAMEALVLQEPADLEAKLFLVVAYYALILPEVRGFLTRSPAAVVRAHQLLTEVLAKKPTHPGALHYWTHLNDLPEAAADALPAVRRPFPSCAPMILLWTFVAHNPDQAHLYSRIAPDSSHAQHMQSHLRLRVGEISKVAMANSPWCDQHHDDLHNLEFLHLGKWANARVEAEMLAKMDDRLDTVQYLFMVTRGYIDMRSEEECKAPVLLFNCTECAQPGDWLWYLQAITGYLSVCGFAAAKRGDIAAAQSIVTRIYDISQESAATSLPTFAISANISALQVEAMINLHAGETSKALQLLDTAAAQEDTINPPAYGPPMDPIKCSNELYGEVLLSLGNFTGAIEQFAQAQQWYPNRTLILLGLAKSWEGAGNKEAARLYYQRVADQLVDADYGNPILAEAEAFLHTLAETKKEDAVALLSIQSKHTRL